MWAWRGGGGREWSEVRGVRPVRELKGAERGDRGRGRVGEGRRRRRRERRTRIAPGCAAAEEAWMRVRGGVEVPGWACVVDGVRGLLLRVLCWTSRIYSCN